MSGKTPAAPQPYRSPIFRPSSAVIVASPRPSSVAGGWNGVTIETIPLVCDHQNTWLVERQDPLGTPLRVVTAVQAENFQAFWLDTITQSPRSWPRGGDM